MTSVSAEAAAADTRMQQTSSTDGGAVYRLQSSSDVPAADAAPSTVASTTADNTTQNAQIHRNQASSQNQFLDATEKPQGVPQTAAAQAPAFTSSTDQHGPSLNTQDGSSSYPDNNNNTNDAQLQLHSTPDPTPSHMHSSSSGPPLLSQNRVAPQTTTVSPDSAPHDLDSYGSPSATSTLAIASDSAHHHHPHHLQQQPSSASDQEPRSPILSPTSTTVPYESAGRRAINSPTAPSTAYPRHDQYPQRQHQQQYPSQSSATDASNPESPPVDASNGGNNSNNNSSFAATSPLPPAQRRPPVTRNSLSIDTLLDAPPPRLRTKRKHGAADAAASSSASASPYPSPNTATDTPPSSAKRTSSQGQRELLLVKSLASAAPDERRASTQRPPVSYKPPAQSSYSHHRQSAGSTGSVVSSAASSASTSPGGTGAVRVPPIRSFRSSGSRKSLNLDTMNYQYYRPRPAPGADSADESGDDPGYHRTLRALEGRNMSDALQNMPTSPTTAVRRAGTFTFGSPSGVGHSASNSNGNDHDDGGDVFLRIAREEGSHRANDLDETQSSVVSRLSLIGSQCHVTWHML